MKKSLYIFVGYPGAGKTTTAKLIHELTGAVHLWADHERHKRFKPVTHSKQESDQLYEELNDYCSQSLAQGDSVIYDTNFNFYEDRQKLRQIAKQNNADLILIWVKTSIELARQRAVSLPKDSSTRVLGLMTEDEFNHNCSRLEPPSSEEAPVIINGENITPEVVRAEILT